MTGSSLDPQNSYQKICLHPDNKNALFPVESIIHSVCVTKGLTWIEAYDALVDTSGKLGLMHDEMKTLHGYLTDQHFFRQANRFAERSVAEIIKDCNDLFDNGEVIIVYCTRYGRKGFYLPIAPITDSTGYHYALLYPNDLRNAYVTEVWISWKDGCDHSVMPRKIIKREYSKRENHTKENEALVVDNKNPNGNLIGDCAVRAIAGVLEISWTEAVRKLAAAQDYRETRINITPNIDALLLKEGFEHFGPVKRDGKTLSGKQFCDHIHDMFQAGTKIFAYVGNSHVVAILVFDGDYKIVDTWDSTDRKITGYWAKYPDNRVKPSDNKQVEKLTEICSGTRIVHKTFGIGEVISISGSSAEIRFDNVVKQFSVSWIIANCLPAA